MATACGTGQRSIARHPAGDIVFLEDSIESKLASITSTRVREAYPE
jgi:hypothetical protein